MSISNNKIINMKKVFLSGFLVSVALSSSLVFAESTLTSDVVIPSAPTVTTVPPVTENRELMRSTNLVNIKARGIQLIDARINSLKANAVLVANSSGLTPEQKTAYASFFEVKISDLHVTRRNAITNATDVITAKALVSSIFTDLRIYGVVIPQIRLQKRMYELQNHGTKLNETFVKVQAKIDEWKAKGKDVTVWQKNLDDAKTLVVTDNQKLANLLISINNLKPSDYGTVSKTANESANKDIKSIASDFNSIRRKVMRPEFLPASKVMNAGASVNH